MRFFATIQEGIEKKQILFCHHATKVDETAWGKEGSCCLDCCRILFFVKAEHGMFIKNTVYEPNIGDVCFIPPLTQFYGLVPQILDTDYFQIDVGLDALQEIPQGRELLNDLLEKSQMRNYFANSTEKEFHNIIGLCQQMEEACRENQMALAYGHFVIFLCELKKMFTKDGRVKSNVVSKHIITCMDYIEKNYDGKISNETLANICGVSESFLMRTFKKEVGISIHSYLNRYRLMQSIALLDSYSVTDVSFMCGFSDSSHYIMQFKKLFRYTPYEYKKQKR